MPRRSAALRVLDQPAVAPDYRPTVARRGREDLIKLTLPSGLVMNIRPGTAGTRSACEGDAERRMTGQTACFYLGCRHNLLGQPAHDVPGRRHEGHDDRGRARLLPELWSPQLERWPPSCALDVADRGEHAARDVARFAHVTRRRVEQISKRARELARDRNPDEEIDEPTGWGSPLAEAQALAM